MTRWSRARLRLRAVVRRSWMEREMDAELRFPIEAFAEDLVPSGVPRGADLLFQPCYTDHGRCADCG